MRTTFILSMVFFTFDVRDNKKMLSKNKGYRGLAANSATAASSYSVNWNYSIEHEEERNDDLANVQLSSFDIERMFRTIQVPANSELKRRFMTVDFATTGFDNIVLMYWEEWTHFGYICKDVKFCTKNTNREGVMMIMDFRDKHKLQEKEMILDVQGFGFLKDCFPRAMLFSGATQASNRGKSQYKTIKDEAGHLTMEMIQSGLIHFDPSLADARYYHQNMKREGATTILRHMKFEGRIFQFKKTPNGRIEMIAKDLMKSLLKGMSPDLFDNVIQLCGATCYDCYRMLRDDAGIIRQQMQAEDMLAMLGVNGEREVDTRIQRVKKIRNASEILNILSTI